MSFGKLTARQLALKLEKVPEEEMLAYHNKRMKKYRWYFIGATALGIISVIFIICRNRNKIT